MTTTAVSDAESPLRAIFHAEAAAHSEALRVGLLALAKYPDERGGLPAMARAAESLKGAAKVAGVEQAFRIAREIERCLTQVEEGRRTLSPHVLDRLVEGVQSLVSMAHLPKQALDPWLEEHGAELKELVSRLAGLSAQADAAERPIQAKKKKVAPPASSPFAADLTMLTLFRTETEGCAEALNRELVNLDHDPTAAGPLEALMRAAHSIKGAARIVGQDLAVRLAHAMEDCFVAAQDARIVLDATAIDHALHAVDFLLALARGAEEGTEAVSAEAVEQLIETLGAIAAGAAAAPALQPMAKSLVQTPEPRAPSAEASLVAPKERVVRVGAQSINRLMGLAGESLVEARRVQSFGGALQRVKKRQSTLATLLENLEHKASAAGGLTAEIAEAKLVAAECQKLVAERIAEFDAYARRVDDLGDRLYREALKSRMRPFADGIEGFARMARDTARKLDKQVKLEVTGGGTDVDRDVLESLEAPLNHLVRNAIDHGIELPEDRVQLGKASHGTIRLEARHQAGMLSIVVHDDGRGVDPEIIRKKIVERAMVAEDVAKNLTQPELLEFILLPGFSTAEVVSEISGRGVGLDIVRNAVEAAGGSVRIVSELGQGSSFHLLLPVTRSVLRAVLVEIAGEPYAIPLLRADRIARVPFEDVRTLEGRQYFSLDGTNIGLIRAHQILGFGDAKPQAAELSIVIVSDRTHQFGVVVDAFLGEHDLVVHPLDTRLGKVPDVAAAAILTDGTPALILDVDDLVRSIDRVLQSGHIDKVGIGVAATARPRKRILVVDDSITVRQVQRQLLLNHGYEVDVAVDGMDGWNAVRGASYDLVITDIDMPRMNGIELVRSIRQDDKLKALPVVVVSYKDREEDRLRGLDAGANYYLTKSSFHDNTLLQAAEDLIGKAER